MEKIVKYYKANDFGKMPQIVVADTLSARVWDLTDKGWELSARSDPLNGYEYTDDYDRDIFLNHFMKINLRTRLPDYDLTKLPDPGKKLKPVKDNIEITKVGIRNFVSPIDVVRRGGDLFRAKGTFSCYVSLKEHLKGTHMSRLAQVIQETTLNRQVDNKTLHHIADELLAKVDTSAIDLKVRVDYPLKQLSLRSMDKETGKPNFGWMYYPTTIQLKKEINGDVKAYYKIEYQYSSTCPCSYMMSEDWRSRTGHAATPHAQRSTMETTVEFNLDSDFHIEDLIHHHRAAIMTEVLGSIVKREDELYFSIINAEQPMFVEDAVRYMYDELSKDDRIKDFVIVSSHHESLHDHDATAVVHKNIPNGLR